MEKAMASHSSILAWKIPWMEEPGCTGLSDFTFTFHFHALEKEMATHSSVLAWRVPGMGEPGGLPSRVAQSRTWLKWLSIAWHRLGKGFRSDGKNPPAMWETWVRAPWRRAWQPTPVFLPGESSWTEEPGGLQSMGSQSWTQLSSRAQHST